MTKSRILVVEDEGLIALNIQKRLEKLGYEIVGHAASEEEAISLAGSNKPDLVLMDIQLEGPGDGIQAAETIFKRWQTPIVFLTAYSNSAFLERAKVAFPYGYLVKPFREEQLHAALQMALHKNRQERIARGVHAWSLSFVRTLQDPVLVVDMERRITFINDAAATLLDEDPTSLTGRSLKQISQIKEHFFDSFSGNQTFTEEDRTVWLVPAASAPIPGIIYPIRDEQDRVIGVLMQYETGTGTDGDSPTTTASMDFKGTDPNTCAILEEIAAILPRLVYITAASPYCEVTWDTPEWSSRDYRIPIQTLDKLFPDRQLLRIHRSYLVSTGRVLCTQLNENTCYEIWLKTRTGIKIIPMGRSYLPRLREHHPEWFGQ